MIVGLVAGMILLITFPAIGEFLRHTLLAVLGDTLSSGVGALANIIGIGGFVYLLIRWIWADREGVAQAGPQPTGIDPADSTDQPDDQKRKVITDTKEVAKQVSNLAAEFERRSPFNLQPGETFRTDFDSPEYQAEQQQKGDEYSIQMDELKERYRKKKWFFDSYREHQPDGSPGYMIYVISDEKAGWLQKVSGLRNHLDE